MEIDISEERNSGTPLVKKSLVAVPVVGGSSGEGLPYAPEDWPCPGDVWSWKVGKRKSASGIWVDRYLSPPPHLRKPGFKKLPSRPAVADYIRKEFPDTDVNDFFSSFIWRIPCVSQDPEKDAEQNIYLRYSIKERSGCESITKEGDCKAGNKICSLLTKKARGSVSSANVCEICCSEASFCRDCCCILCCRTIEWVHGGYGFIKCEASLDENYICGHVAHIECALRCYMAGTVGENIGLDAEYYCRRCDNRTDLIPHVAKLIKTCENLDSGDIAKKILNLGLCILRGSEQMKAKELRNQIGFTMAKLKQGDHPDEIWKLKDNISTLSTGNEIVMVEAPDITRNSSPGNCISNTEPTMTNDSPDQRTQRPVYITSDHNNVSMKLEDEIDQVLQQLKRSQESEYRVAEQKLYARKDLLLSLYQQLEVERSDLGAPSSRNGGSYDTLLTKVLNRVDQIKDEEAKLRRMMSIAKGFGQAHKAILVELFGMTVDE